MLFTQVEFFVFLGVLLAVVRLTRSYGARKRVLLAASYYFYAYWDWRFLSLLVLSTLINFYAGLAMGHAEGSPRTRRTLLAVSIASSLGILGFFKCYNFFISSLQVVLAPLGVHMGTLNVILPIGISFFTFQTMSYTIDVYRHHLSPCRSLCDFALFVAFFPQLVAGPIVRASEFLPQLSTEVRMSRHDAFIGFRQFTIGLFKKAFVADHLALFVDYVFENAGVFSGLSTWLAVAAYGMQIYYDFSGYSDMAIGVARVFGYHLPVNFRSPYLATSITEFWRRWHITLSTWLRDYLYIPLGGNRKGTFRTYVNLLVTMVLGGLWHGASWTFVCWGALHGLALASNKWITVKWEEKVSASLHVRILGWATTMLIVFTAWVFFRASSFHQAYLMFRQMYFHPVGIAWYHPLTIAVLALILVLHVLLALNKVRLEQLLPNRLLTPVVLFTIWWVVVAFPPRGFKPFVYFQF